MLQTSGNNKIQKHTSIKRTDVFTEHIPTLFTDYPLCGVPTIRADIRAPQVRRISDRTNYGDQGNAYALLYPTIFSEKGVYERDFFKTRPKEEVENIDLDVGFWRHPCYNIN